MGVQSFADPIASDPNRRLLVFAINTYDRWSSPSLNEFDVLVDVDNNGSFDYVVVGVDQGAVTWHGSFNGTYVSAVFSLSAPEQSSSTFLAFAPTDGSTALLPCPDEPALLTGEPCMSRRRTRASRTGSRRSTSRTRSGNDFPAETAKFNAWNPSIESGQFETIAPGGTVDVTAAINRTEFALTPAKGLMAVITDNRAGNDEAELVQLKVR